MSALTLVIGNKAFSSWSLRPWLALKQAGASFDEVVIPLGQPDTATEIAHYSPSGRVPVLIHNGTTIWESLAICEYVAELFPAAGLWPDDPAARAVARSVASEMHAGFTALRRDMSMNLKHVLPGLGQTAAARTELDRLIRQWRDVRSRFGAGGPFLFGRFSIADAMFAPVCTRLTTYRVAVPDDVQSYIDTMLALPALQQWIRDARAEPWDLSGMVAGAAAPV